MTKLVIGYRASNAHAPCGWRTSWHDNMAHEMHMRHIVICCSPLYNIFPRYKLHNFRKKQTYWEQNLCFDFLCNFRVKLFFILRRTERDMIKNVYWSSCKAKVKAVPLQAWSGPGGSRKLRFPDFVTTAHGGKIVYFRYRPPLPTGNTPGTHFC